MHLVWFKRDLRLYDNQALAEAARLGPVLLLYVLEPELWNQPDMSGRQYQFLIESLADLEKDAANYGYKIMIRVGNILDILSDLHKRFNLSSLSSHQETWNDWTYKRDIEVGKWCLKNQIRWNQPVQNGVIRRLKDRNGWANSWYRQMKKPTFPIPKITTYRIDEVSDSLPNMAEMGLNDSYTKLQVGGRKEGLNLLDSFLFERGEKYTKEMSSPNSAFSSCSRLSPYLAFGCLSIREVFQATEKRQQEMKYLDSIEKGKWPSALRSFSGRLRWHCHFIQKLEDEPQIELRNMHSAYDGLREKDFNESYFEAWKKGQTGYPMVDACMRALIATGWINFRMRAMLMSFASYHLWLHWRKTAIHLANLFTDYEPGIHYSQVQMQSGTTGINAIRIYNPIKQGKDQDPHGIFIREWIPELKDVETALIHTPWLSNKNRNGYPEPIVDEKIARKLAADKLYSIKKNNASHKTFSQQILKKHGSRKSTNRRIKDKKENRKEQQGDLFLPGFFQ